MELYPLKFEPILKERIWGGTKLRTLLNKNIQSDITGESWELSGVEGDISIVADGPLKGHTLTELMSTYKERLLGSEVFAKFGATFPLLFKYLDAREDLSIQVHPNDELARKRHNSFGKTEMWYVVQADPGSRIIVGFREDSSADVYLKNLENKSLLSILDTVEAVEGDVFFLETGTVHAIGAGLVVAEIQQTSDITYRIYDFDRKDADGHTRQLHTEEALEAINYNRVEAKVSYERQSNEVNNVVSCPYFTTDVIPLDGTRSFKETGTSFKVFMCVQGEMSIRAGNDVWAFKKGDTVLVPAAMREYSIEGKAEILSVSVL